MFFTSLFNAIIERLRALLSLNLLKDKKLRLILKFLCDFKAKTGSVMHYFNTIVS